MEKQNLLRRTLLKKQPPADWPFAILVVTLVAFGLVMLFSASYAVGSYRFGDPYTYIRPQALFAVVGLAAMWAASRVDYHIFHKLAWPLLGLSAVRLLSSTFRSFLYFQF